MVRVRATTATAGQSKAKQNKIAGYYYISQLRDKASHNMHITHKVMRPNMMIRHDKMIAQRKCTMKKMNNATHQQ
jgi:exonuclease I